MIKKVKLWFNCHDCNKDFMIAANYSDAYIVEMDNLKEKTNRRAFLLTGEADNVKDVDILCKYCGSNNVFKFVKAKR
jgi:DNA-directed RNA polymerase subunit RPC12/RpoP